MITQRQEEQFHEVERLYPNRGRYIRRWGWHQNPNMIGWQRHQELFRVFAVQASVDQPICYCTPILVVIQPWLCGNDQPVHHVDHGLCVPGHQPSQFWIESARISNLWLHCSQNRAFLHWRTSWGIFVAAACHQVAQSRLLFLQNIKKENRRKRSEIPTKKYFRTFKSCCNVVDACVGWFGHSQQSRLSGYRLLIVN